MRRSLVFMLTLIFVFAIFAGPAAPKADAVVVSSIIVGTVIAAMAAAGIGLTVSGMTSSQLTDWVGDKLSSWAASLGGSVEDHINGNLITATASGIISIGTSAANSISNFITWIVGEDDISDNSQDVIINGNSIMVMTSNVPYNACSVSFSNKIAYYTLKPIINPTYVTSAISERNFAGPLVVTNSSGTFLMQISNSSYNDPNRFYNTFTTNQYDSATGLYYCTDNWIANIYDTSSIVTDTAIYTSVRAALDAIKTAIDNNSFGQGLIYDTGVITIPNIDTTTQDKWFIDVGAAPGATIETVTDGVIADTIAGELNVSGEVAEEEPEFVVDGPIAVSGLTEVFPFCIPFDIYALLSSLSADPQIPVFTARFVVPGIIDEEFTIDLTPFNAVAQIVRTMELLAFIIGLALVTRERFLRS